MKALKNYFVIIISLIWSNNMSAQFSPLSGGSEQLGNGAENVNLSFGFNTITSAGTKGINFVSSYSSSPSLLPTYAGTVFQLTNQGTMKLQCLRPEGTCSFSLMRSDQTYGDMNIYFDNFCIRSKNNLKFYTNNMTKEILTLTNDQMVAYGPLSISLANKGLLMGFSDDQNGWIGVNTNHGCYFGANNSGAIYLDPDGKVYVGGITASVAKTIKAELKTKYKLFVKGGVLSEDYAIAPQSTWSDFVFTVDYNLRKLEDVETYIKDNNHLPDVPPAAKVAQEGYSQHEMNKVLLQKIEELTLYTIQQQKEIKTLNGLI